MYTGNCLHTFHDIRKNTEKTRFEEIEEVINQQTKNTLRETFELGKTIL